MPLAYPLHELVAATHTPFRDDGAIAPEVVPTQASFLSAQGIRTVFISGSTGECHSLSREERCALLDAWADVGAANGLAIIAHVGGNSIEDATTLARVAERRGLTATSAMAPSYYKPSTIDALVEWCATIAAAAPSLPFFFYDIPALTGVALPMERFVSEAIARVPNFAGVKFTNPDLVSYRRALDAASGNVDLPWGIDETLLAALAIGAQGGVGSTYNFAPGLYRGLIEAFRRGDLVEARRRQAVAIAMIDAIADTGYLGTAKALMVRLGVPVGRARAPLGNPHRDQVDALVVRLRALGFDEWGAGLQ